VIVIFTYQVGRFQLPKLDRSEPKEYSWSFLVV